MQTTLRIDGELYRQAKSEAARQGVTITRYIEEALKLRLRQVSAARGAGRVVLPTFAASKGFPYTSEELKALAQRTEAKADRAKAPVKRRR